MPNDNRETIVEVSSNPSGVPGELKVYVNAESTDHDIGRVVIWTKKGLTPFQDYDHNHDAEMGRRKRHCFTIPASEFPITVDVTENSDGGEHVDTHRHGPFAEDGRPTDDAIKDKGKDSRDSDPNHHVKPDGEKIPSPADEAEKKGNK